MYGRQVYTMAIQIPNLTSYSGSWMVWFAEPRTATSATPTWTCARRCPLHMVSPKYIHSAVEDRVEGKVRLWAVIGRDGHVGDISLLQHLDDRLDRSAEEALGKWRFQPARAQRRAGGRGRGLRNPLQSRPQGRPMTPQFLLIDADDTLWENNIYFERAFDEFVAFLDHSSLTPARSARSAG